jgi:hypothetical protein
MSIELPGRFEVVPERLLDHDMGVLGEAGVGEAAHHGREQRGRDLEVEDGPLGLAETCADPLEGVGVGVVALHVGDPGSEPREDVFVGIGDRCGNRLVGVLAKLLDAPVVDRDADDRAVELAARLQAIERPEGHFLRQVAGDPEYRQHVGGRLGAVRIALRHLPARLSKH